MNRTSRRSAADAAEALLEAGRTQPALNYDVELGLARHHQWLRSEAPMPEWASASASTAAKSLASVVIKTLVSSVLMGALGFAAWHARDRLQPSAAEVRPSPNGAEHSRTIAPSAPDVTASDALTAPRPIPVVAPSPTRDQPARRTLRAAVPDQRSTRLQRARKDLATAPVPSARPVPRAAPERKPVSAAPRAPSEPEPRAQGPDDLAEMQQVATAEQLLERSPERALALVREGDRLFARGYFKQERAYIAIMALIRLGRLDEARARAESFAKRFPPLPYGARIRSALEAREAAATGAESR